MSGRVCRINFPTRIRQFLRMVGIWCSTGAAAAERMSIAWIFNRCGVNWGVDLIPPLTALPSLFEK